MRKRSAVLVGAVLATMLAGWPAPALAADEVLSGNIREADGSSGQNTNTGAGIKTNHIQNGAVTSTKIKDGTVAAADLANNAVTTGKIRDGNVLAADLANGSVTAAKVGFYSRVIIVDINGGGDFTSPVAALASITDAGLNDPYLVKIMPGVYDVGASPVQMRAFVDIEGSGEKATRITGSVSNTLGGLVNGVSEAEIRFLTIENTNALEAWTVAFYAPAGSDTSLLHVTAHAIGVPLINSHQAGVYCDMGSAPRLRHVTAIASAGSLTSGVYVYDASPVLTDVTAEGKDGLLTNVGIELVFSGAELRRVAATGSGPGGSMEGNFGLLLRDSSPIISETIALAVGHTSVNTGLRNEGECRPELRNVSAHGIGGGQSFGMDNWAQGDGAIVGEFQIVADRCTFRGLTSSVRNDREYKVTFGASKLDGSAPDNSRGGTLLCLSSYNSSAELTASCVP